MANERSEKSRFASRYTNGFVSAAQYLSEIMCERQSKKDNVHLPDKFWNDLVWKKDFLLQLKHANELLKTYSIDCILSVLKDRRAANVYSLGLRSVLIPLLEKCAKLDLTATQESPKIETINTTEKPRPPIGKATLISKLKDL